MAATFRIIGGTIKTYLFGALAGLLGLLTLIAILYMILATVAIFYTTVDEFIRAEADGTLPTDRSTAELIGSTIFSSAGNGLRGVWQARYGFLVFGALGAFVAWAHQIGLLLYPKRAWLVSFVGMLVIISVAAISWIIAQKEQISLWLAESPELYYFWRDIFITSYATDVAVSLILALIITYPVWAVWRSWYTRLLDWFPLASTTPKEAVARAPSPLVEKQAASSPESRPDTGQTISPQAAAFRDNWHSGKFIKPLAILLILCALLIFPIKLYHDQIAVQIQFDRMFIDAETDSQKTFIVEVKPETRKIRVVNFNGLGTVNIRLSQINDDEQIVGTPQDWTFEWRDDELIHTEIPLTDIAPGEYSLHFQQESGWGYFEYTLSHGGGRASSLSALAIGFLMACSLVLGAAIVFLIVTTRLRTSSY